MPRRKEEGSLFPGPAEDTPRQPGEPHDVVAVPRPLDIYGALHQRILPARTSTVCATRALLRLGSAFVGLMTRGRTRSTVTCRYSEVNSCNIEGPARECQ